MLIGLLFCFISMFGWGDEVIRYVDPDSAAGGDGTTWALAYDSLFDWEAAEETDLDTANDWHHCYVRASSGTADTTAVSISGTWETSVTDYILIEAASTDRAVASGWSATKYSLSVAGTCLTLGENNIKVDGLQIYMNANSGYGILTGNFSGIEISNCRIKSSANGSATTGGIVSNNNNSNLKIWNCIIHGFIADAAWGFGIYKEYTGTWDIYNCVTYGCGRGIGEGDTTVNVTNSASFNNDDDFYSFSGATIDYCASDDNDGTHNVAESGGGASWPDDFEGAATGDFRLKSGSNLVSATTDQSGGLFTDDIEGTTRGASWDVGAFEYDAGQVTRSGIVIRLLASMWFTEALRLWVLMILYSLLGWGIKKLHNGF